MSDRSYNRTLHTAKSARILKLDLYHLQHSELYILPTLQSRIGRSFQRAQEAGESHHHVREGMAQVDSALADVKNLPQYVCQLRLHAALRQVSCKHALHQ
jgi:hypothetical protein